MELIIYTLGACVSILIILIAVFYGVYWKPHKAYLRDLDKRQAIKNFLSVDTELVFELEGIVVATIKARGVGHVSSRKTALRLLLLFDNLSGVEDIESFSQIVIIYANGKELQV